MVDRDWSAIYAVVLEGWTTTDHPLARRNYLSAIERTFAEVVTDHLVGSLTQGDLRKPRLR